MKKFWHYLVIFDLLFFAVLTASTSIRLDSKSSYPLLNAFTNTAKDNDILYRNVSFQRSLHIIQELFSRETQNGEIYLPYDYWHHLLHTHLFKITQEVTRFDLLKPSWEDFLMHAEQNAVILYPNKNSFRLNLSRERELLEDPTKENWIRVIRPAVLTQPMLDQIMEIENQSFSEPYREGTFLYFHSGHENRFMLLALNQKTQVIEGFLLYNEGIISSLARRVNSPCMGIGKQLFEELAKILAISSKRPSFLRLEVRESNTEAIEFYKKWGFRNAYITETSYYRYPEEKAQVMLCSINHFLNN